MEYSRSRFDMKKVLESATSRCFAGTPTIIQTKKKGGEFAAPRISLRQPICSQSRATRMSYEYVITSQTTRTASAELGMIPYVCQCFKSWLHFRACDRCWGSRYVQGEGCVYLSRPLFDNGGRMWRSDSEKGVTCGLNGFAYRTLDKHV